MWLTKLIGWWRMVWGLCPWCNSDAPALYHCPVCCYGAIARVELWNRFTRYLERQCE
jgi:hypothetical protein